MRRALAWLGIGMAAAAAAEEDIPRAVQVAEPPAEAQPAGPEWVVSRSKQFHVAGGESVVRATVAWLADETKNELLKLTAENDTWKVPVRIRLHGRPGDPLPARTVAMRLVVIEGVSDLRMDVHLSRGLEEDRFKHAVTTAWLYERALRAPAPGLTEKTLVVPPWLAEGLREAVAWNLKQNELNPGERRLYEAVFRHGGIFKLDDLFATGGNAFENLDAAMRAAFRVSSGALVMALLEQPQGKEGFRAFLNEAAAFEGEMPVLLRKHFPELNLSETSLAKWWALQLAAKGGVNLLTDILSIQQTESQLADALRLHFPTPEGIVQPRELNAWPELAGLKPPERAAAVRLAQDGLVRLSYRCFPSYRPLLADYQAVLAAIANGKTHDTAAKLAALEETRAIMSARAARGRDYLDWFEITRARETSGAFNDYLRLKQRLKANPHHRNDKLSQYLDRLDKVFHREHR